MLPDQQRRNKLYFLLLDFFPPPLLNGKGQCCEAVRLYGEMVTSPWEFWGMGASISCHGGDGEMVSISSRVYWEGINNGVWHLWGEAPFKCSLPKSFTFKILSWG